MNAIEIFKTLDLSERDKNALERNIHKLSLKKGDILLKPGESTDFQYFIVSGCLRSYFKDKNSKDHTLQFAITDWWISDYTSFFNGGKSILYIECIQDAVVFRLSRTDMEEFCKSIYGLENFFRNKTERFVASFQRRLIHDHSSNASERYAEFIETYPEIEKQVKKYHIASYLGIAGATLSRVKKQACTKTD